MTASTDIIEFTEGYHQQALESEEAQGYYNAMGVTKASVEGFRLGWVADPLSLTHVALKGCSVVPYLTVMQRVKQLRYSTFEWDLVKSYEMGVFENAFPLDQHVHLFNAHHAMPGLRTNHVILVPDVLSVILLRQRGYRAVGVPGFKNFMHEWFELFQEARVSVVYSEELLEEVEGVNIIARGFRNRSIEHSLMKLPQATSVAEILQSDEAQDIGDIVDPRVDV